MSNRGHMGIVNPMSQRSADPRRRDPGQSPDPASASDDFLLAEARAKARLLLICSRAIDANPSQVLDLLPADPEARAAFLGTLHQMRRRLETDRSMVEAALARWTLEADPALDDSADL